MRKHIAFAVAIACLIVGSSELRAAPNSYGPPSSGLSGSAGAVVAASTTDLSAAPNVVQTISGSTAITSLGSGKNLVRFLSFTGAPLLTNGANLVTGTGANIQACPGDTAMLVSDNSGTPIWTVMDYTPFGGVLTASVSVTMATSLSQAATLTPGCGRWEFSAASVQSRASTVGELQGAISTTTASSTGTTAGTTNFSVSQVVAAGVAGLTMPISDVTLTGSTPYFFNVRGDVAGATFTGTFRMKRIY